MCSELWNLFSVSLKCIDYFSVYCHPTAGRNFLLLVRRGKVEVIWTRCIVSIRRRQHVVFKDTRMNLVRTQQYVDRKTENSCRAYHVPNTIQILWNHAAICVNVWDRRSVGDIRKYFIFNYVFENACHNDLDCVVQLSFSDLYILRIRRSEHFFGKHFIFLVEFIPLLLVMTSVNWLCANIANFQTN